MLRRLLLALAALSLASAAGAPVALADGPSITVGPITINGNPGCC